MSGELLCVRLRCHCSSRTRYRPWRVFSRQSSEIARLNPDDNGVEPKPILSGPPLPSTFVQKGGAFRRVRLLQPVGATATFKADKKLSIQPKLPDQIGTARPDAPTKPSRKCHVTDSDERRGSLGSSQDQPWLTRPGPIAPLVRRIKGSNILKKSRSRTVTFPKTWAKLYKSLLIPEDGDLFRARERMEDHRQAAVNFVRSHDIETLRASWNSRARADKARLLPSLLAGCLADSPGRTLVLLTILSAHPRSWRTRCECLCYLDLVYSEKIKADSDLQLLFARQMELVSNVSSWPEKFSMPRLFLVLLLRYNNPQNCDNIIARVLETHPEGLAPLFLSMVDYFTRIGDPDRAIDVLWRVAPEQREMFRKEILDRFKNLIRLDTIEEAGAVRNFRILPRLIEFDLPMDGEIHNTIIERAIALGRPNVAWELFRYMEVENIDVDARRHLILLRDSFDRNDHERLNRIMSAIDRREDLYKDPYLVAYMMHIVRVVCCIDRKLPPESSFSHILAIYDRAFERGPLVKLGLADALPAEPTPCHELPQPPPGLLGFTIWAYVLCQQEEGPVWKLWHWIVHMMKQGDVSICKAAEHDVLYNGFIHFFGRNPSTIDRTLVVVQEMIELQLCMPTKRTWSEVLCGFLQYGDDETAEKIWSKMLANEMRFEKEGWEYLLAKFDKSRIAQEINHVLDERRMPEDMTAALGNGAGYAITEDSAHEDH